MSDRIKIKYWWDAEKKWFCIIVHDGVNEATVSLTLEEASLLSMNAVINEPADALIEDVAQWLHDETDDPDSFPDFGWPLHENDTGQRGADVWKRLIPLDVVEAFRAKSRRLVARFGTALAAQPASPLRGRETDIRWAVNVLLEKIAEKFDAWDTHDVWRSDAAATVRGFKHDLSSASPPEQPEFQRTNPLDCRLSIAAPEQPAAGTWIWCTTCGVHVDAEIIAGCRHIECPKSLTSDGETKV